MRWRTCPEHGKLALELARGGLDSIRAAEVEATVAACSGCRGVMESLLDPEVAAGVDEAFAALTRARHRRRWLSAAAAAAVLVVAAGLTLLPHGHSARRAAAPDLVKGVFAAQGQGAADLNHDGRVDAADLALSLARGGAPTPRS